MQLGPVPGVRRLNNFRIFQSALATNVCKSFTFFKLEKHVKHMPKRGTMILGILAKCLRRPSMGAITL